MNFFRIPLILSAVVLAALYLFTGNPTYVYQALALSFVEVSMSFDNAVINAAKLETMSHFWREAFLIVGLPIAVIGMRFFLPLLIVSVIGETSIAQAWTLALNDQAQFASILISAHTSVVGFGGAFLLMTALEYFMNGEKETHWLTLIESNLVKVGKLEVDVQAGITLLVLGGLYLASHDLAFLIAGLAGVLTFILVGALKEILTLIDERLAVGAGAVVKGGIGTLIYLEILDASFSFDGVIAAFAISNDIFVVAAGLGIGALFVRAMTIKLVEAGTLSEYVFLENGAFWSILALSVFMFAGLFVHIADYIIAGTSVGLIALATLHSILVNRADAAKATTA